MAQSALPQPADGSGVTKTIITGGDLQAPEGSLQWILARRGQMQQAIINQRLDEFLVRTNYEEIRAHGGWEHLVTRRGRPFRTFAEFCAHPQPEGLGMEQAKLEAKLGAHGGDRKSRNQDSNGMLVHGGNNSAYTLARLDRDRPDLAAKVRDKKLSANAAAIEAGFRRKLSPLEQIVKLLPKLSTKEIAVLLVEVVRRGPKVS